MLAALTFAVLHIVQGHGAPEIAAYPADRTLEFALRKRLQTARLVAMAKHNSGAPVEDKARERQVIFGAVRLAVKEGVDVEVVLKVMTAQIEANKAAQRTFLDRWKDLPPFDPAPDLAKVVRPELDRLTPMIVRALKSQRYLSHRQLWPLEAEYRQAWGIAVRPLTPIRNR